MKCGKNQIRERIDLFAQAVEFGNRQIAAFEAFFYLRQSSLKLVEVFSVDGRAGLLGLGSKETGPLHDFAYVAIVFLLAGTLGRHRRTFGWRLGIGLRSELVQTLLDRGQAGFQTLKCGKNRIRERSDLLA